MALKSQPANGQAMIDLVRELKAAGHMVTAVEVGKLNSHWVVEFYEKEVEQPQQVDLFHPPHTTVT